MESQLELLRPASPEADPHDVETLMDLLRGRDWLTAREVLAVPINTEKHWNDRYVRALAAASSGRIISGQRGYKLTREAKGDEAQRAIDWLRHQADEMRRRSMEISHVFHTTAK